MDTKYYTIIHVHNLKAVTKNLTFLIIAIQSQTDWNFLNSKSFLKQICLICWFQQSYISNKAREQKLNMLKGRTSSKGAYDTFFTDSLGKLVLRINWRTIKQKKLQHAFRGTYHHQYMYKCFQFKTRNKISGKKLPVLHINEVEIKSQYTKFCQTIVYERPLPSYKYCKFKPNIHAHYGYDWSEWDEITFIHNILITLEYSSRYKQAQWYCKVIPALEEPKQSGYSCPKSQRSFGIMWDEPTYPLKETAETCDIAGFIKGDLLAGPPLQGARSYFRIENHDDFSRLFQKKCMA